MIPDHPLVTEVPDPVTLTVHTAILVTKAVTSQGNRDYFCLINDGTQICNELFKKKIPTWTNRAAHSRLLDWIYAGHRTHLLCTHLLADAALTVSAWIFMPIFTLMVCGIANWTGFWVRRICNVKPKTSLSKMGYACYLLGGWVGLTQKKNWWEKNLRCDARILDALQ